MKTPVIIAAYNEAEHIGSTLRRLDAADVEPIVVVNGDDGAAETLEEASRYTERVYMNTEQGKLPAIQLALRLPHDHDAAMLSQPLLLIDADSKPVFPKRWHKEMTDAVSAEGISVASGTFMYSERNPAIFVFRALRAQQLAKQGRDEHSLIGTFGRNMAINFKGDADLLDATLEMPHIWPGEDRYIASKLGGEQLERFTQIIGIGNAVLTSNRFTIPFGHRLIHGNEEYARRVEDNYASRRASSVTHTFDWRTDTLTEYENN